MKKLDEKRIKELNKLYFGNQSLEISEKKPVGELDKVETKKNNDFITEWQVEEQKEKK